MILAILLLFSTQAIDSGRVPGDSALGEAQLQQWTTLLRTGQRAEAEAMIVGDANYRYDGSSRDLSLNKTLFLDWIKKCKAGIYANVAMPTENGRVTRVFNLVCPKREASGKAAEELTEKIGFFLSSDGKGIRIW